MAAGNRDRRFSAFPVVLGQAVGPPIKDESDCESFSESDAWTALYEVLDMKILHVSTKDSVEVYGKIILHSSTGFVFLLNREKNNAETVKIPGGSITLTNPKIGMNGLNPVGISFELGGDLEELNDEFLNWTYFNSPFNLPFNTLLTSEIKGRNCSLAVRYIVFSRALVANLEIKLLREEEEEEEEEGEQEEEEEGNATTICGEITASFSEYPSLAFTLFDKMSDDCVTVSGDGLVLLSKSVIAVPLGSDFDIKVNLLVAAGKVRFSPRSCGDYIGIISDKIEVKVTFWDWYYHPETRIAKSNFKFYNDWSSDEEDKQEEEM